MTQEQREHIATTIGIMDMASAILRTVKYTEVADVLGMQCEVMQEVLNDDLGND